MRPAQRLPERAWHEERTFSWVVVAPRTHEEEWVAKQLGKAKQATDREIRVRLFVIAIDEVPGKYKPFWNPMQI